MGRYVSKFFVYAILIVLALCFIVPFYVLIVTSLKPFSEVSFATMWQLPSAIDFSSYVTAFQKLAPNFMNTIIWSFRQL